MADTYQPEVTRSIRSWGFWTLKPTDAYQAFGGKKKRLVKPDEPGRADMIVTRGHRVCYVELKDATQGFAFTDFEQNKRVWTRLMQDRFGASIWLFLILGIDPPNRNREKYPYARRAWLLPIETLFRMETMIPQKTLPMIASKGYNTMMQKNKMDAVHLLADYELPWGKGNWLLPENHCFRSFFND